jgi:hypothetical protein
MNKRVFIITTLMLVFLNQVYGTRKESLNKLENTESVPTVDNTLVIIGSVKSYIKIYEGENLTIDCDVERNAKASKTWYKVTNTRFLIENTTLIKRGSIVMMFPISKCLSIFRM